jgi:hypothetical protein
MGEQRKSSLIFSGISIPILMTVGKLTPLGDPAPNAPKIWISFIRIAPHNDGQFGLKIILPLSHS